MKLKSGMSALLADNPKALEQARKKYYQSCTITLDLNNRKVNGARDFEII